MASKKAKRKDTAAAAARRKAHFEGEPGAGIALWRGRAHRFEDGRKAASKRACRGRIAF